MQHCAAPLLHRYFLVHVSTSDVVAPLISFSVLQYIVDLPLIVVLYETSCSFSEIALSNVFY